MVKIRTKSWTMLFVVLSLIWVCFIWGNSMQVAEVSSGMSGGVVETLQKILRTFSITVDSDLLTTIVRKGAHFSEYLLLAGLVSACHWSAGRRLFFNAFNILFLVLLTAVLDEFIQKFVSGRSSEVRDVLIDLCGGITGFLVCLLIQKCQKSPKPKSAGVK